jgi:hypothetical protein
LALKTTIIHSSFCVLCPILTVSGLSNLDYLFHFFLMFIYLHALLLILEQNNFQWDDEVCFVLDHHAGLDFYSASSLKQQSADRHVAPLRHIILIPSSHWKLFCSSHSLKIAELALKTTITHSSFCVLCPILTVSGLSNLDYLFHFFLMLHYLLFQML